MNRDLLNQCVNGALAGTLSFGETISHLLGDGVEWYTANLVQGVTSHYAADLSFDQTFWPDYAHPPIAEAFSSGLVIAAVLEIQKGRINYREFIRQIAAAGIVSYTVHLQGRKVIYFGRHGDLHIEMFPA